jgi:uncharacterized damage-inducible protein DinB
MKNSLSKVFEKDLNSLFQEINAYQNEDDLWKMAEGISNSAGNLCLHIQGNLLTYIGAEIGQSGYVRNRPLEFSDKVSKENLLKGIKHTKEVVVKTLQNMDEGTLSSIYPIAVFGDEKMQTSYFLVHLVGHLNYHLGQINYHRRILCYS